MRSDNGWATAQMPTFVNTSQHQKPTFVPPAQKAQESSALSADVEAFVRSGGLIERITTQRHIKRNGRGA